MRKSKALDWLLHNVEIVDPEGKPIDRELVLGHTHDDEGHDGDDGHTHDGHTHEDHAEHDHEHDHEDHPDPEDPDPEGAPA
jgi:hypothetical protein